MKKRRSRWIAWLLSLFMILSILPMKVWAEDIEDETASHVPAETTGLKNTAGDTLSTYGSKEELDRQLGDYVVKFFNANGNRRYVYFEDGSIFHTGVTLPFDHAFTARTQNYLMNSGVANALCMDEGWSDGGDTDLAVMEIGERTAFDDEATRVIYYAIHHFTVASAHNIICSYMKSIGREAGDPIEGKETANYRNAESGEVERALTVESAVNEALQSSIPENIEFSAFHLITKVRKQDGTAAKYQDFVTWKERVITHKDYYIALRKVDETGTLLNDVSFDLTVTDGDTVINDPAGYDRAYGKQGIWTGWDYNLPDRFYINRRSGASGHPGIAAVYLGSYEKKPTVTVKENWTIQYQPDSPDPADYKVISPNAYTFRGDQIFESLEEAVAAAATVSEDMNLQWINQRKGSLSLKKQVPESLEEYIWWTDRNGRSRVNVNYSLAGAVYGVFVTKQDAEAKQNCIAEFTTDEYGTGIVSKLSSSLTGLGTNKLKGLIQGEYFLRELVKPERGFELDDTVYSVEIGEEGLDREIKVEEPAITVSFDRVIRKKNAAEYVAPSDKSNKAVAGDWKELLGSADWNPAPKALIQADIKSLDSPSLNPEEPENTRALNPAEPENESLLNPVEMKDEPAVNPVEPNDAPSLNPAELKVDPDGKRETGAGGNSGNGTGSLAGTEFTLMYWPYGDNMEYTADQFVRWMAQGERPFRTWVIRMLKEADGSYSARLDAEHLVSGDPLFTDADGQTVIPLGWITIEETAVPEGFTSEESFFTTGDRVSREKLLCIKTSDAGDLMVENEYVLPEEEDILNWNQPVRGDIRLQKKDQYGKGMEGVIFRLTNLDTKESHILSTDAEGGFSTAAAYQPHSAYRGWYDGGAEYDGTRPGIWFSQNTDGTETSANDTLGALPVGTYRIEEMHCKANEGKILAEPEEFTVDEATDKVIELSYVNYDVPKIRTELTDSATKTHIAFPGRETVLMDTVFYEGLLPHGNYIMEGTLHRLSTGEILCHKDGTPVVAATEFVAEEDGTGTVSVEFRFDAENVKGDSLVAFETCVYAKTGETVAVHEETENWDQTVVFPKVRTSAAAVNGNADQLTITDTLTCSGLIPGLSYTAKAVLMTGKGVPALLDGKTVRAEKSFIPEKEEDKVVVELPAIRPEGQTYTYVVYEEVYVNLKDDSGNEVQYLIGEHKDLRDAGQTVSGKRDEEREEEPPEVVITPPDTTPPAPVTGDTTPILPLGLLLLASGAGWLCCMKIRKK